MRLDVPFVRLPFRVDAAALQAEVAALPAELWRAHPEGAPGNTAVALIAHRGDPDDDRAKGVMAPTPHLDRLPYVRRIIAALDSVIGRTRLMRIEEEGELTSHIDTNYYWRDHLRVHFPVQTAPEVQFECDGDLVHMAAGEAWVFDTWRKHRVVNPSHAPRIHLVVDTVGSAPLWDRIDHPDAVPEAIAVDGPDRTFETERVNQPTVMTPWELEHALDLILGELDQSDPAAAVALDRPVLELARAWRSAWARFGDAPEGRAHYVALRDAGDAAIAAAAADARLPNGVSALEAMRQHALRAAVDADAVAPEAAAPRVAPTTIERPVFIVSSPRSGSTLLFETLALAPGLFTIGGESHQLIERVPGFAPASHGWDSNRLTADDATLPPSTPSAARSPPSCVMRAGTRPPVVRCACSRRRPRTRSASRCWRARSPTVASSTSTATRGRPSAACSTRGSRAASSPTATCPDGTARRGRCCSCRAGATLRARRWRRSSPSSGRPRRRCCSTTSSSSSPTAGA